MAFTMVFYALAGAGLLASLIADRRRTGAALKKAWKAFSGILPEFLVVLIATGLILAYLNPQTISRILGSGSGWLGVLSASLIGSVTLIPGFVAFPLAALLLQQGAGIMQIGAFVSSLMMVGVVTFPLERRTFGLKIALTRNLLAFGFSLCVAFVLSLVLIRKGCNLFNLMVFIGAWSTTKIPMFLFEYSALGAEFALTRLAANIPAILLISLVISRIVPQEEYDRLAAAEQ